MYIHERKNWIRFDWDMEKISPSLEGVAQKLGLLHGRLENVGFDDKIRTTAENIASDVVSSSEIEGVRLNTDQVRSSVARRLGIENIKQTAPSHYVDSVVAVMLDALKNRYEPMTKQRLCAWQSAFFPAGTSEGSEIETGIYRTHEEHIISGFFGRERIHYVAPSPDRVEGEMKSLKGRKGATAI